MGNFSLKQQKKGFDHPELILYHLNVILHRVMKNKTLEDKILGLNRYKQYLKTNIYDILKNHSFDLSGERRDDWKSLVKSCKVTKAGPFWNNNIFLTGFGDIKWRTVAYQITKLFYGLKELTVERSDYERNSKHSTELFITITTRQLIRLEKLTLFFYRDETGTNEGLARMGYEIGTNLVNLKYLRLSVEKYNVTEEGVRRFLSAVNRYMTSLVRLELQLCEFDDKVLEAVGDNLHRGLARLVQLKLVFINNENISEKALEGLCIRIKKYLTSLQHLFIKISRGNEISSAVIKALKKEFQHLATFEVISLY